jgi:hypothetical protein
LTIDARAGAGIGLELSLLTHAIHFVISVPPEEREKKTSGVKPRSPERGRPAQPIVFRGRLVVFLGILQKFSQKFRRALLRIVSAFQAISVLSHSSLLWQVSGATAVKNCRTKCDCVFPASVDKSESRRQETTMNAATLMKGVRNPHGGVHVRSEEMTAISVIRDPNRTLFKVRWRGGERVVSSEEFEEILQGQ